MRTQNQGNRNFASNNNQENATKLPWFLHFFFGFFLHIAGQESIWRPGPFVKFVEEKVLGKLIPQFILNSGEKDAANPESLTIASIEQDHRAGNKNREAVDNRRILETQLFAFAHPDAVAWADDTIFRSSLGKEGCDKIGVSFPSQKYLAMAEFITSFNKDTAPNIISWLGTPANMILGSTKEGLGAVDHCKMVISNRIKRREDAELKARMAEAKASGVPIVTSSTLPTRQLVIPEGTALKPMEIKALQMENWEKMKGFAFIDNQEALSPNLPIDLLNMMEELQAVVGEVEVSLNATTNQVEAYVAIERDSAELFALIIRENKRGGAKKLAPETGGNKNRSSQSTMEDAFAKAGVPVNATTQDEQPELERKTGESDKDYNKRLKAA